MDEAAREQFAQHLSAMALKEVRREIRSLDPDADMTFWRNAVQDEYHTLWLLPNAGISITLVEKVEFKNLSRSIGGGPGQWKGQKAEYRYLEARVKPLDRPVKNQR